MYQNRKHSSGIRWPKKKTLIKYRHAFRNNMLMLTCTSVHLSIFQPISNIKTLIIQDIALKIVERSLRTLCSSRDMLEKQVCMYALFLRVCVCKWVGVCVFMHIHACMHSYVSMYECVNENFACVSTTVLGLCMYVHIHMYHHHTFVNSPVHLDSLHVW
jgi:hypothetical protein